jgi:hypothetical protein
MVVFGEQGFSPIILTFSYPTYLFAIISDNRPFTVFEGLKYHTENTILALKENWFANEIVCIPEVYCSCSNSKNNFIGSVDSIARNLQISYL